MKKVYLVRHCEAEGQASEAPLTANGLNQAQELAEFFSEVKVDRIVSSPYTRAVQSMRPLADKIGVQIEKQVRLAERVLSSGNLPDWQEKLTASFEDADLKYEGGESGREATERIVRVVEELFNSDEDHSIVVTHGNILSLLLKHFNPAFGFTEWQALSNPDVFVLIKDDEDVIFERLWS